MKICAVCNAENEDDTVFCTECGGKFPAAPEPQPAAPEPQPAAPEPQPAAPEPQPAAPEPHSGLDLPAGSLKFSDTYQINFMDLQQVIGRSELSATAKNLGADPLEISRQHLTIYSESNKCYIVDGTTSVQEKPSSNHTKVNGKDITDQGAIELNDGDEIQFATTVKAVFHSTSGGISNANNNSSGTDNPTNQMSDDEIKNKYDNMPDM